MESDKGSTSVMSKSTEMRDTINVKARDERAKGFFHFPDASMNAAAFMSGYAVKCPVPSQWRFKELMTDRAFVDYFNVYLQLPVYGRRMCYKHASQTFMYDPPIDLAKMYTTEYVFDWCRKVRYPMFTKTSLYMEYCLCTHLRKPHMPARLSIPHSLKTETEWSVLVDHVIGYVVGMRQFRRSLRDTSGHQLIHMWMDLERYKRLEPHDARRRLLSLHIREKYMMGDSNMQLKFSLVPDDLHNRDAILKSINASYLHPEFINDQPCLFSHLQGTILDCLRHYWLSRHILFMLSASPLDILSSICNSAQEKALLTRINGITCMYQKSPVSSVTMPRVYNALFLETPLCVPNIALEVAEFAMVDGGQFKVTGPQAGEAHDPSVNDARVVNYVVGTEISTRFQTPPLTGYEFAAEQSGVISTETIIPRSALHVDRFTVDARCSNRIVSITDETRNPRPNDFIKLATSYSFPKTYAIYDHAHHRNKKRETFLNTLYENVKWRKRPLEGEDSDLDTSLNQDGWSTADSDKITLKDHLTISSNISDHFCELSRSSTSLLEDMDYKCASLKDKDRLSAHKYLSIPIQHFINGGDTVAKFSPSKERYIKLTVQLASDILAGGPFVEYLIENNKMPVYNTLSFWQALMAYRHSVGEEHKNSPTLCKKAEAIMAMYLLPRSPNKPAFTNFLIQDLYTAFLHKDTMLVFDTAQEVCWEVLYPLMREFRRTDQREFFTLLMTDDSPLATKDIFHVENINQEKTVLTRDNDNRSLDRSQNARISKIDSVSNSCLSNVTLDVSPLQSRGPHASSSCPLTGMVSVDQLSHEPNGRGGHTVQESGARRESVHDKDQLMTRSQELKVAGVVKVGGVDKGVRFERLRPAQKHKTWAMELAIGCCDGDRYLDMDEPMNLEDLLYVKQSDIGSLDKNLIDDINYESQHRAGGRERKSTLSDPGSGFPWEKLLNEHPTIDIHNIQVCRVSLYESPTLPTTPVIQVSDTSSVTLNDSFTITQSIQDLQLSPRDRVYLQRERECHRKETLLRPVSLAQCLGDNQYLESFQRFAIRHNVTTPLRFLLTVQEMKDLPDKKAQISATKKIARTYLSKQSNPCTRLHCNEDIIRLAPSMKTISPALLCSAQQAVYKTFDHQWFNKYQLLFDEIDSQHDITSLGRPSLDSLKKYTQPVMPWLLRRNADTVSSSKLNWKRFAKHLKDFSHGLLHDRLTLRLFYLYIRTEIKVVSPEPQTHSSVKSRVRMHSHKQTCEKNHGISQDVQIIVNNKPIILNKVVQDIEFWIEVRKFKDMYESILQENCINILLNGADRANLKMKGAAIINCFLNSEVHPKIRINITPELASSTIAMFENQQLQAGNFHEAYMVVFPYVLQHWCRFVNTWKPIDLSRHDLCELYVTKMKEYGKSRVNPSPHASMILPNYFKQPEDIAKRRGDEARIEFTQQTGIVIYQSYNPFLHSLSRRHNAIKSSIISAQSAYTSNLKHSTLHSIKKSLTKKTASMQQSRLFVKPSLSLPVIQQPLSQKHSSIRAEDRTTKAGCNFGDVINPPDVVLSIAAQLTQSTLRSRASFTRTTVLTNRAIMRPRGLGELVGSEYLWVSDGRAVNERRSFLARATLSEMIQSIDKRRACHVTEARQMLPHIVCPP